MIYNVTFRDFQQKVVAMVVFVGTSFEKLGH